MNAPCRNCPDRHVNCHSQCGRYTAFISEVHEVNERKRKELNGNRISVSRGRVRKRDKS